MKKMFIAVFILTVSLILFQGCKKEILPETIPDSPTDLPSLVDREYDENQCWPVICIQCDPLISEGLTADISGLGKLGIDDNTITLIINNKEYVVHAAEYFKSESTELYISTDEQAVLYSSGNEANLESFEDEIPIPVAVEALKNINQDLFKKGQLTPTMLEEVLGNDITILSNTNGNYRIQVPNTTTTTVIGRVYLETCGPKVWSKTQKLFTEKLGNNIIFENGDIAEVVNAYMATYGYDPNSGQCVNTQWVVNYLLENNPNYQLPATNFYKLQLNYLSLLFGFSTDEYNWFNSDNNRPHIVTLYENLDYTNTDSGCADCGNILAGKEIARLYLDGTYDSNTSASDFNPINSFYNQLYCDDRELFNYVNPLAPVTDFTNLIVQGATYGELKTLIGDVMQLQGELGFDDEVAGWLLENGDNEELVETFLDWYPNPNAVEEDDLANGILILWTEVGADGVPSWDHIGQTEYRHPIDFSVSPPILPPDLSNNEPLNDIREDILQNADDQELFQNMLSMFLSWFTADDDFDQVAIDFINHFEDNSSPINLTPVFHPTLSEKAMGYNKMRNFMKKFGAKFEQKLIDNNGNPNIPQFMIGDDVGHPSFSSGYHKLKGMTILMNDTEQTTVWVDTDDFDYNPVSKIWEGTFYFHVVDHFGLDFPDIETRQNFPSTMGRGFASWYVLQHDRDYIPFRTELRIRARLYGNIN